MVELPRCNFFIVLMVNNKTIKIECPEDSKTFVVNVPIKKLKSDHVRAFQEGLLELIVDDDLSGDDLRAFLGVLAHVEFENTFTMSLTALSAKLGIDRSNLSKAIAKLVKKRYLTKVNSQGRVNHYMVDPRIAFKSRVSKFTKVVDRWDDLPQVQH